MKYLLDTDTCIALLRGNAKAIKQANDASPADLAISSITHYELKYGVRRCHPKRIKQESHKLQQFTELLHELPFTTSTADKAALIRHELASRGKPIGPMDTLIAATAIDAGLILITGNLKEFTRIKGLQAESWME